MLKNSSWDPIPLSSEKSILGSQDVARKQIGNMLQFLITNVPIQQ